ncbi:hypothetical protein GCM10027035_09820 [Emticicia sediminis]
MIKIFLAFFALINLLSVREVEKAPPSGGQTGLAGRLHAFHTSLTEIQYNAKEKSLEISIRMFTDDLETALTKANNGQKVMVGGKNDNSDAILNKYVQQHFAILLSQKQKRAMNVLGKEIEGDATWVYVEMPNAQDFKGNILYNSIMQELFDDQTNLVNFLQPSGKKTYVFNAKTKIAEIE